MKEYNETEDILTTTAPRLNEAEKAALWNDIEKRLPASTPTPSPYWFNLKSKKHMAPIALALILMLGGTGVVAAAETSRPGDSLFVLEQKIEGLRLALASDDKKTQLEARFAAERLLELSSILDESVNKNVSATTTVNTRGFEAEADVYTDMTIVEVEINDRKTVFVSAAKTKDEVAAEIAARFGIARSTVDARLDFEVENRASRTEERNSLTLSQENEVRVNNAVAITLGYLLNGSFGDDERDELLEELSILIDGVPVKIDSGRIRIDDTNAWVEVRDDEDDDRLEIRDDSDRIRIFGKDGEIRIDTKGDFDDDWDDRDDRDEFEAEADVFSDHTVVKVEINNKEHTFETKADSRASIVTEISNRFNVSESEINAKLDLEVESRDSRDDDHDDDSDDKDDEDGDRDDDDRIRISL